MGRANIVRPGCDVVRWIAKRIANRWVSVAEFAGAHPWTGELGCPFERLGRLRPQQVKLRGARWLHPEDDPDIGILLHVISRSEPLADHFSSFESLEFEAWILEFCEDNVSQNILLGGFQFWAWS